jgi:hypothetical protein
MKASEILRGLADLLSGLELKSAQPVEQPQQGVSLIQVTADNTDHSDANKFLPPLQAKLELLKKATGVESVYDQQGDDLDRMKQMAGIHPVALDAAGDSEPLDI